MILYWALRLGRPIWQRLPRSLAYFLASGLADLSFLLWWRLRRTTMSNLRPVLGPEAAHRDVVQAARQSLRNYGKYLVDFLRLPGLSPSDIERLFHFAGWEAIDSAVREGRGVVVIGLHMGNWDLGGAALALRDYPLNVVVEPFRPRRLNEWVQDTRRRLGMRTIPMESLVAISRVLRRNEMLGLLIDRPDPLNGVWVSFCNAVTRVPAGAATLALRSGARVVTAGVVRLPDNTYLGVADAALPFEPTGDLACDVQHLTQLIMTSLEGLVRRYPDQWYMFRPMWLERPQEPAA